MKIDAELARQSTSKFRDKRLYTIEAIVSLLEI